MLYCPQPSGLVRIFDNEAHMAKKVGKIEQYNLTQRVLDMATRESKPSREITRILKTEG